MLPFTGVTVNTAPSSASPTSLLLLSSRFVGSLRTVTLADTLVVPRAMGNSLLTSAPLASSGTYPGVVAVSTKR